MSMTPEHREAVRAANRRRASHLCQSCGQASAPERDGSEVDGLPGTKYRQCCACGWIQAVTRRPRKADNPLFDK